MKFFSLSFLLPISSLVLGTIAGPAAPAAHDVKVVESEALGARAAPTDFPTFIKEVAAEINKTAQALGVHAQEPEIPNDYQRRDLVIDTIVIEHLADYIANLASGFADGSIISAGINPGLVPDILQMVWDIIEIVITGIRAVNGTGSVGSLMNSIAKLLIAIGNSIVALDPLLFPIVDPAFKLAAGIVFIIGVALAGL